MSKQLFNVMLSGELTAGFDKEKALQGFAALFNLSESKARATLDAAPITIKKNTDSETAYKLEAALARLGIKVNIEPSATAPLQTATPAPAEQAPAKPATAAPQPGYPFEIKGQPDYSFVEIKIPANETLKVEASSMATMDTHLKMKTKLKGGFGRFLSGESIFINEFTAEGGPGEIGIAPGTPGDIMHRYLDGDTIYLQNSAFVAATQGVAVESKWQGLTKGFFSGESLFLIRCSGKGDLWFNTYGAIIEIDVSQDYVVDTGNIVAFTDGLDYRISKVGGYKSLFFSGEGFVCRFSGKGKVWIQTRGVDAFASWAHYFRPVRSSS